MLANNPETIVAIATPPGQGGIGVIRVSGDLVPQVAEKILGFLPKPRQADYTEFLDENKNVLDHGIALYFQKPHSFTGEHVLELHAHGGPVLLDCLLKSILKLNVRLARPGEFSERAFLNNKLDLVQAEAIADLISASSEQAVQAAVRTLQGEFSHKIKTLVSELIYLRTYLEASIDFSEEEIDFLAEKQMVQRLEDLLKNIELIYQSAKQGSLLREGMTVVIAGYPNAGKSSLLNQLSDRDVAIVTDIPGTTRDVLKEHIHIDGLPLHIVDTAGLRESEDPVEQEGVRRALKEIEKSDCILLVVDANEMPSFDLNSIQDKFLNHLKDFKKKLTIVRNKCDLTREKAGINVSNGVTVISLSAKTGEGVALLRNHLKKIMGFETHPEGCFTARRRHLESLSRAEKAVIDARNSLKNSKALELLAEDLRAAQTALNEITGEFTTDDLLGKIFSSFCVGK